MNIDHQERPAGGLYRARPDDDGPWAQMTYSIAGEVMVIDHTEVPDDWRGQGVGAAMVRRAVDDARAAGRRIHPTCSFAVAQFQRHPDWSDVLN